MRKNGHGFKNLTLNANARCHDFPCTFVTDFRSDRFRLGLPPAAQISALSC